MTAATPITVIVPTIGRSELLAGCLRSVLACVEGPAEVVVVDQSHGPEVVEVLATIDDERVRRVVSDAHGTAAAMNTGLAAATHDSVMVTHDDCTVDPSWVQAGRALAHAHPEAIVTGRVLAPDGSPYVPSTKDDPVPHDYTGQVTSGVLYPANMVVDRRHLLDIGGFDERTTMRVAEDNDLCYRWLRDGRPFRYEPSLVVLHHDWRTPEQIVRTHIAYARAHGAFYAKHLHARDRQVLPLLRWDLNQGVRALVRGARHRIPRWQNPYREMVGSLLVGLYDGWREARRLDRDAPSARG